MTELSDLSDVINRVTGGNSGTPEHIFWLKDGRVLGAVAAAPILGRWTSLWEYEGSPSHGIAPTSTGVALDSTTQGGLKQTNPGGVRQKWLLGATAFASQAGTFILYDRLAHDGGLSGTDTAAQTVSFTPPARYNDGIGNQIWIEIYTQIGASATTFTCAYTDQGGGASTTQAIAIGATGLREAQRIIPVTLAAGDTGVQNITNVDLVATTGTAGAFAAVLVHPLAVLPVQGATAMRDFVSGLPSVPEIETDACLAWAFIPSTTTALTVGGSLHMIEA